MRGRGTYLSEREDERGDRADKADTVEVGSGDGDVTNMDPLKGQQCVQRRRKGRTQRHGANGTQSGRSLDISRGQIRKELN